MPTILAHRGNRSGPSIHDNQLSLLLAALRSGWGVEVDVRRAQDGRFYLSHDPVEPDPGRLAASLFAELRRYPAATVAINIKECGDEPALIGLLVEHGVVEQCFLFDMELVELVPGETARHFRALHSTIPIAARVSDRNEPIERALAVPEASIVWLDEFDRPWATAADIRRLHTAGRVVFAVSPDLHGASLGEAEARWAQLLSWGVDGICTDYPEALADVSRGYHEGVAA